MTGVRESGAFTRPCDAPPPHYEAFWAQVDKTGACWVWTGRLTKQGYGCFRVEGVEWGVHRYSWMLSGRVVPKGLHLDHVCHNRDLDCPGGVCLHRSCVNPAHLEVVTPKENFRRGRNANRRKTHCPHGHPYDDENTVQNGAGRLHRRCLICKRARDRGPTSWAARRRRERAS